MGGYATHVPLNNAIGPNSKLDADSMSGFQSRGLLPRMRREEMCGLRVNDMQSRQGVVHFRVRGKRGKVRLVPVHAMAQLLIEEYVALAGHGTDAAGPVFRPVTNNRTKELDRPLNPNSIYRNIILKYGLETGISAEMNGLCAHSLRATAATNALSHEADIAKVQEWPATPMSRPRASMTGARCGLRTVRHSE